MNTLSVLKDTLFKLKKKEIVSLIVHLRSYRKDSSEQSMKSIQLVQLILKNRDISADRIQNILYGKNNYHAFNKLSNRLKEKIYEILLWDSNLNQFEIYGERNCVVFEIRKRIIQAEIMFFRSFNIELEKFLNNIISDAKKYEVFDSLIEALHAKQKFIGFRMGYDANQKIKFEIDNYEKCRTAFNRALEIYNRISSKIIFSSSQIDYKREMTNSISILKKDHEKINAASVSYYYYLLLTESYQFKLDFIKAHHTLVQLKYLLENNISVYTKNRYGSLLLNLANNDLMMYNFTKGLANARQSQLYFLENEINLALAKELEFFSNFYANKIDKAEKIIEELFHASRTSKTPFQYSKRAYLLACIKTFKGLFNESNELLKEVKGIEKDKEGWAIGIRFLSIINSIELINIDKADREIEKMMRHLSQASSDKLIRKRYKVIHDVFIQLMKNSYDFKMVFKNSRRSFNLLESNHKDYRWKIKSPELIIFHEWFTSKVEDRSYNHLAAIQKEKEKYLESVSGESL